MGGGLPRAAPNSYYISCVNDILGISLNVYDLVKYAVQRYSSFWGIILWYPSSTNQKQL